MRGQSDIGRVHGGGIVGDKLPNTVGFRRWMLLRPTGQEKEEGNGKSWSHYMKVAQPPQTRD
jgi:hypothetical protein